MTRAGRWRIGLLVVLLATAVRLAWAIAIPTIPVGDFATYRESAIYLAEFGRFDRGFIYMPGLVVLLAAIHNLGGEVLAAKILGAVFGGVAAGPIYVITAHLVDDARAVASTPPTIRFSGEVRSTAAPVAATAALLYALWPAGIAMASVVGTDVPAATTILIALALLCAWGDARPVLASAAFGAAMGLAAYFRAVALPLTVLSAGYWLARRAGVRATVTRTAVAVAMTVLMLLPWGLHNRKVSGELYLTDSHGGVTALMGNDPNTEGTYSRSLSSTFRQLTGRTFLAEPHRETDRIAYGIARQWMGFEPLWTAGMIALRCERLFAAERGLLYWPIYRPGVLPDRILGWFNQHRATVTGLADIFYLMLVLGFAAGVAFAVGERRWTALVPLPFAAGLAGTYALFVAEPRYRLTSEVLLFPIAAYGLARLVTSGRRGVQAWLAGAPRGRAGVVPSPTVPAAERRGLLGTLVAVGALVAVALVVVRGGALARARHRWAVAVWHVDGRPASALWRGRTDGVGPSPVRGAPPAVRLTLAPGQRVAVAEVVVPEPELPAGRVALGAHVVWDGDAPPGAGARLSIGDAVVDPPAIEPPVFGPSPNDSTLASPPTLTSPPALASPPGAAAVASDVHVVFDHAGGRLRLPVRLTASQPAAAARSVLIQDVTLTIEGMR